MSIEKLSSGKYRISQVYHGKRYRVIVDHKPTTKEATILMAEEMQRFHDVCPTGGTYEDAYKRYVESRSNVCSPSTLAGYEVLIRNTPEWFKSMNVFDIDQPHVQRLINDYAKAHSPKTTRNMHGLVSAVIKMVRPEVILCTRLPAKKAPEVYIPSDAEIKMILREAKGTKYEVPFYLAVFGLRRSEICALTIDDLNGNLISVTKAKVQKADGSWVIKKTPKTAESNRLVYVTDYVRDLILNQGYVYKGHPENIKTRLSAIEKKLGIRHFSPHKLRHYFASMTHELGISDANIMAMGGWKTDNVMKTVYRHSIEKSVADGQKKYAEKIDSLQEG